MDVGDVLFRSSAASSLSATFSASVQPLHLTPCNGHCFLKHGLLGHPLRKTTCRPGPYGPVNTGSVAPNNATQGFFNAAAMCMGPLSFVSNASLLESSPTSPVMLLLPARFSGFAAWQPDTTFSQTGRSSGAPSSHIRTFGRLFETASRTDEKNSAGQFLLGHLEEHPTARTGPSPSQSARRSSAAASHSGLTFKSGIRNSPQPGNACRTKSPFFSTAWRCFSNGAYFSV